ncbi:MAG: response regulator transcription factor [Bacteroidia bacterium]|nr:response regulator transcription factor [Bacteroidia bacterium]
MQKILVADSAYLVREGLKTVLSGHPDLQVVGEAGNRKELFRILPLCEPDLLIFDYYDPANSFSIEDVKTIVSVSPQTHILIISSWLDKEKVMQVLGYGAKGFLLKECDETEILGAIHAIKKNEKFFCGKVLDIILERHTERKGEETAPCEPANLTQRETEIVRMMGEGASTSDIAEGLSLSVHTVYTHRKNIMRKLGVKTASEVILYAINTSLVKA